MSTLLLAATAFAFGALAMLAVVLFIGGVFDLPSRGAGPPPNQGSGGQRDPKMTATIEGGEVCIHVDGGVAREQLERIRKAFAPAWTCPACGQSNVERSTLCWRCTR